MIIINTSSEVLPQILIIFARGLGICIWGRCSGSPLWKHWIRRTKNNKQVGRLRGKEVTWMCSCHIFHRMEPRDTVYSWEIKAWSIPFSNFAWKPAVGSWLSSQLDSPANCFRGLGRGPPDRMCWGAKRGWLLLGEGWVRTAMPRDSGGMCPPPSPQALQGCSGGEGYLDCAA